MIFFKYHVDEVYTVISTNVVGTNYYNGLVGIGEMVALLREPQNMYDSNAIRVVNVSGALHFSPRSRGSDMYAGLQVGHIPRNGS